MDSILNCISYKLYLIEIKVLQFNEGNNNYLNNSSFNISFRYKHKSMKYLQYNSQEFCRVLLDDIKF